MEVFDTCFFERYAKASLSCLFGGKYDNLVNLDRPDLQCIDHSLGVEVTRAIPENRYVAQALVNEMAGSEVYDLHDAPYSYGLATQTNMNQREYRFWSLALPLRRILENKIRKVASGFYGNFEAMELYVFSKEDLEDNEVADAISLAMQLQEDATKRYRTIYISQIQAVFACDTLKGRYKKVDINEDMRTRFYHEAALCNT